MNFLKFLFVLDFLAIISFNFVSCLLDGMLNWPLQPEKGNNNVKKQSNQHN